MEDFFVVKPELSKDLTYDFNIEQEKIVTDQIELFDRHLMEQIKFFNKAELEYLQIALLTINEQQKESSPFIETILKLIDQQLRRL